MKGNNNLDKAARQLAAVANLLERLFVFEDVPWSQEGDRSERGETSVCCWREGAHLF